MMKRHCTAVAWGLLALASALACGQGSAREPGDAPAPGPDMPPAGPDAAPDPEPPPGDGTFVVMTMNIGTDKDASYGEAGPDGYGDDDAAVSKEHYGNGLSWTVAEDALRSFLADERPDVVVFQEGFFDDWCTDIPELGEKFVCHGYTPSRPLQIERLLGPDYQVACARGQEDNCAGVRRDFATIRGCPLDRPCMAGLDAPDAPGGCSSGARVGAMVLDLASGEELTVINVHARSGATLDDMMCRVTHFEQIFEDGGDGAPLASGDVNLIMGDINTDPFMLGVDPSASYWNDQVGEGKDFHYISSDEDDDGPATYAFDLRIDHIVSDQLQSLGCEVPGADDADPVLDDKFWDHRPVICRVEL